MPSASPAASSASDGAKTKKKALPSKKGESEVEDSEAQESGGEDGDDDEEEYEIEAILDAKKGHFEKNKIGYLVSWKGYGPEHNSWVAEDDAGNATLLIKAFWDKKKSSPKKGAEAKRPRKSVADDASDAEGSASVAKKRGRKSVSEKPADKDDERPTKKPRKASEKKAPARESPSVQQEIIGDMQNHMTVPSWDHLVDKVDTVERVDDTLFVYFTLYSGERVREDSKKCADKFPKKLIDFYESNLRWKEVNH
ncbi:hypothetical protein DFH08DRAFT_719770 [Mycena albidolilacea]|uniref:Chromo domain-containing protein n=1 Tax=Mycena albidolilacea TaxID=1033008 RepID=A0AAD6Z536_9AGAR|nr:hypothetical protein DFH08DRAFT_719770 [Mycena albidolilacea]